MTPRPPAGRVGPTRTGPGAVPHHATLFPAPDRFTHGIDCGVWGCPDDAERPAIVTAVVDGVTHTFGVCGFHLRLIEANPELGRRPMAIRDGRLVLDAVRRPTG